MDDLVAEEMDLEEARVTELWRVQTQQHIICYRILISTLLMVLEPKMFDDYLEENQLKYSKFKKVGGVSVMLEI